MKNITLPYNFDPRSYQLPAFKAMDNGSRFLVLRWHRRAGKDKCCFNMLISKMVKRVGLYFYIFPEGKHAKVALWENLDFDGFRLLHHLVPPDIANDDKLMLKLDFNINNTEMKVTLPNGSVLRVTGSKDKNALRGTNAVGVVFSEYAFMDEDIWSEIFAPVLIQNGGFAMFISTPNIHGDHFEQLCDKAKLDKERYFYSELQCYDKNWGNFNYEAPENIIEEARAMGASEEQILREYGCVLHGAVAGSYYSTYVRDARDEDRIGEYNYSPSLPVDTFWDIGTRDSTCIWFRQIVGDRNVFFDFIEESGKDAAYFARVLAEKGYHYRNHVLPHDAHNRNFVTSYTPRDILREHFRQYKVSGSVRVTEKVRVIQGIQATRKRFYSYCFSLERCSEALIHLENYSKKKLAGINEYSDEPKHDKHSHCADALRTEATFEELDKLGGTKIYNMKNLPDSEYYEINY